MNTLQGFKMRGFDLIDNIVECKYKGKDVGIVIRCDLIDNIVECKLILNEKKM